MQRLEVSGAVRPIYGSLGVKRLNELKQRITTAVASVDEDTLRSVCTELDYRVDICRVTKGSHIEHL